MERIVDEDVIAISDNLTIALDEDMPLSARHLQRAIEVHDGRLTKSSRNLKGLHFTTTGLTTIPWLNKVKVTRLIRGTR